MTMTNQEIFDKVATHLLRQGKRAVESKKQSSGCMYRTVDNLKCALGCLIPDKDYTPDLESKTAVQLLVKGMLPNLITKDNVDFLQELQSIHDGESVADWKDELIRFAARRCLSAAAIPQ